MNDVRLLALDDLGELSRHRRVAHVDRVPDQLGDAGMLARRMRPIEIGRTQTIDLRAVDDFIAIVACAGRADHANLYACLDEAIGKESRRNFGAADLVWKI